MTGVSNLFRDVGIGQFALKLVESRDIVVIRQCKELYLFDIAEESDVRKGDGHYNTSSRCQLFVESHIFT